MDADGNAANGKLGRTCGKPEGPPAKFGTIIKGALVGALVGVKICEMRCETGKETLACA